MRSTRRSSGSPTTSPCAGAGRRFDNRPTAGRRATRLSWFAGGMASTAALGLACAAWLWPRYAQTPEAPGRTQVSEAAQTTTGGGDASSHAGRRRRGGAAAHERDAHRGQRRACRGGRGPVQGAASPSGTSVRRARRGLSRRRRRNAASAWPWRATVAVDVDVDEGVVEVWNATFGWRVSSPASAGRAKPPTKLRRARRRTAKPPTRRLKSWSCRAPSRRQDAAGGGRAGDQPGVQVDGHRRRSASTHGGSRVAMLAAPARAGGESPGAARAALAAGDAPRALEIYEPGAEDRPRRGERRLRDRPDA